MWFIFPPTFIPAGFECTNPQDFMNIIHSFFRCCLVLAGIVFANTVHAAPENDPLGQLLQERQAPDHEGLDNLIRSKSAATANQNNRNTANQNNHAAAPKATASGGKGEADELLASAMGFLGVAYRFGGTSPTGFDCSGFMQYIFRKTYAINLPRTSAEQATVGVAVSRSELQPGDMVFFRTSGSRISHVGMYVGNNRFIHAPRTGKRIEITSLSNKYWNSKYATARRVKRNNAQQFIRN